MSGRGIARRDFLRGALAASAASTVGLVGACRPTSTGEAPPVDVAFEPGQPLPWHNWAGNQACRPQARLAPESEDELVAALARAEGPIRPVGAGHSFSALVPSEGSLIATDLLNGLVAVDAEQGRCEVWSGTRLHQLGPMLEAHGLALPNMPDIDYQTLAGAVSTSTHGTGATLGSFSTFVEALTLATPTGELIECDRERNTEVFDAARCSLGALGVLTKLELGCVPSHRLHQRARFAPLEDVLDDVERLRSENRHLEILAFPHATLANVIETNDAAGRPDTPMEQQPGAEALRDAFRAVGWMPGAGDAVYDALFELAVGDDEAERVGLSWRVLTNARIGRFREMEYTVPAEAGPACLREILRTIVEREIPLVYPIQYRYVKGDDVWLSMSHARDGCSISIHQYADEDHRPVYAAIEPIFRRYEGRPHWGKLHTADAAELAGRYARWRDFEEVRRALDPEGRMLNSHLRSVLGA